MTPDIDAQCARIVEKLKAAAAADPTFAVFGSNSHKYRIGPTVSEAKIRAFESEHGIALPIHYRAFLQQVGNGAPGSDDRPSAGPFYGIYPLGFGINDFLDDHAGHLRKIPFVRPDMRQDEWDEVTKRPSGDEVSDDDYALIAEHIWGGLLPIGHQGCQSYHVLVLHGPHTGRVVNIDTELYMPLFSFEDNFLDWYERWLDEILSGILLTKGPNWFGYTMGGDDRHLLNVFNATSDKDEKLAALKGFGKLISISPESVDALCGIAACEDPELRRKAVIMLVKFAYPQARDALEDLLKGSEEDQSEACLAIYTLARDHADAWVDVVGPIAATTDNVELFRSAGYVLQSSGKDCSAYLVPAASHPNEAIRGQALYSIGQGVQSSGTIDAILKGLHDESAKVVHAALQAHKTPFDDRFLAAYASIAARYPVEEYYVLANLSHRLKTIGYTSTPKFVADFKAGRVGRKSFWSRIFGGRS